MRARSWRPAKRKAASKRSGEASLGNSITISHYIGPDLFPNGPGFGTIFGKWLPPRNPAAGAGAAHLPLHVGQLLDPGWSDRRQRSGADQPLLHSQPV